MSDRQLQDTVPKEKTQGIKSRTLLLALASTGGLLLYCLDAWIGAWIYDQGTFLTLLLSPQTPLQIVFRLTLVGLFAAAVLYIVKQHPIGRSAQRDGEQGLGLLATLFHSSSEAQLVSNHLNQIIDVNPAFEAITGYSREEILGKNPNMFKSDRHNSSFYGDLWSKLQADGCWVGEIWDRRKNGEVFLSRMNIYGIKDSEGKISNYVAAYSNSSQLSEDEGRWKDMAYTDPLTQLSNRLGFNEALFRGLRTAKRDNKGLAVLYLDLDRFKDVNDTLGHQAGDQLLCEISNRLQGLVRETDLVARLGGDEFAVILSGITNHHAAAPIAKKMLQHIMLPVEVADKSVHVGASIGISIYPIDGTESEDLIRKSDIAMYEAKKRGKGRYHFFNQRLEQQIQLRMELDQGLCRGVKDQEFELVFQPMIEIDSGKLVGAEALVRWKHPSRGLLLPAEFINVAEETGQIIALGEHIIKLAANQIACWQQLGFGKIPISVNLSATQLKRHDLEKFLRKVLESIGLEGRYLDLELTGSQLTAGLPTTIEQIHRLQDLPCSLTLDDFGTGYSSLLYLKSFPFKKLKIDQEFIEGIQHNRQDRLICMAVLKLCAEFNMEVIAVGVESKEQVEVLRELGCKIAQGFYFSQPLLTAEFESLLKHQTVFSR